MNINEAIQMKAFKSEWQKAGINLQYTNNWLVNSLKCELKKHDITPQQFNVLRILRGQYPTPVSTSLIRERMMDKMSDASRIVDRLCRQGLVKRAVCSVDKRLVDVLISDKGLAKLEAMDQFEDSMLKLLDNLTEKEAKQLNTLLDKVREGKE